ncbi:hypothetical protein [Paludibacterium denitrificans]|uniref:hypothetical protein n=1 Tax=Paludibacterium denitrificans TaxID=2675226 RepID=UPI001E2EAF13|nr:hypothetical protein [Paludibacterium denitrificans]
MLAEVAQAETRQNQGFAQFADNINAVGEATRALSGETQIIADATHRLDGLMSDLGSSVRQFQQAA